MDDQRFASISRAANGPQSDNRQDLKAHSVQQDLYALILKNNSQSNTYNLRKLREGIVASERIDSFSIAVYEHSIQNCITYRNRSEIIKCFAKISEMYVLSMQINPRYCEIEACKIMFSTSHLDTNSIWAAYLKLPSHVKQSPQVQIAIQLLQATTLRYFDYIKLSQIYKETSCSSTTHQLLIWLLPDFQAVIFKLIKRSYFTISKQMFADRMCIDINDDEKFDELVRVYKVFLISETVTLRTRKQVP